MKMRDVGDWSGENHPRACAAQVVFEHFGRDT
jgi:hypothetical protein